MDKLIAVNFTQAVENARSNANCLFVGKHLWGFFTCSFEKISEVAVLQHHEKVLLS